MFNVNRTRFGITEETYFWYILQEATRQIPPRRKDPPRMWRASSCRLGFELNKRKKRRSRMRASTYLSASWLNDLTLPLMLLCFPCHDEPQHPLWNCKPEQTLSSLDFLLPGNFYHSTGEVANTGCMWVVWLQTFAMSERKHNVHKKKRVLA